MAVLEIVGGAVLGFGIAEVAAWRARRDQDALHSRANTIAYRRTGEDLAREREREAVQRLDAVLQTVWGEVSGEGSPELHAAYRTWQDGLFEVAPYVRQGAVLGGYNQVGGVLNYCLLDNRIFDQDYPSIIERAIKNTRRACRAFINGDDVPRSIFPSSALGMVNRKKDGSYSWVQLTRWLDSHPDS